MGARDRRRRCRGALLAVALAAVACATGSYSACPVGLDTAPSADAFAVCRDLLGSRFGALVLADAGAFRLQTAWSATPDEAAERRATVFRTDAGHAADLAVVVEVRRLREPLLGLPGWTEPRGDAAAERELAAALRAALNR